MYLNLGLFDFLTKLINNNKEIMKKKLEMEEILEN
jgi:hypothetical protein